MTKNSHPYRKNSKPKEPSGWDDPNIVEYNATSKATAEARDNLFLEKEIVKTKASSNVISFMEIITETGKSAYHFIAPNEGSGVHTFYYTRESLIERTISFKSIKSISKQLEITKPKRFLHGTIHCDKNYDVGIETANLIEKHWSIWLK